jgi:hypothetical protein
MYTNILITTCLASVIIFSIIIATYATNLQKDFNTKMHSVVDQVNTSQYYQYELEKKSYDNLTSINTDMTHVKSDKPSRNELSDRLSTNLLDVKNIKQHDGDVNIGGSVVFKDNINLKSNNKNLDVNLPLGGGFNVKDASGKALLNIDNKVNSDLLNTNKLNIGNQFQLKADNDLLKVNNKDGTALFGGMEMANLSVRDNSTLNDVTVNNANITGPLTLKGGVSEHNPGRLPTLLPSKENNKNYIRGDTEITGNITNVGDLTINRDLNVNGVFSTKKIKSDNIKLGHNLAGSWYDGPLSVYSKNYGASFGGDYFSHFPSNDGNTYIRPGKTGGNIIIGDQGNTQNVNIGSANTVTRLNGSLCVQNSCLNSSDLDKIKRTADNNLLELQKALQDKLAQADVVIKDMATQKANQDVAVYQQQQQIREKSLQEQINAINLAITALQSKINNGAIALPNIIGLAQQFGAIGKISSSANLWFGKYGSMNADFAASADTTINTPSQNSLILNINNGTFSAPDIHVELSQIYTGPIRLFRRNANQSWTIVSTKNVNNASFIRFNGTEAGG